MSETDCGGTREDGKREDAEAGLAARGRWRAARPGSLGNRPPVRPAAFAVALGAALLASAASGAAGQGRALRSELGEGPALLSAIVQAALANNRDLESARHDVGVAERQVSEAWSGVYPSLDVSSSYTRNVAPQVSFLPAQIFDPSAAEGDFIPVQFGADNIWNLSVTAEQTVFDPAVFVGVGAAARFRGLQEEALRGRSQQVVTRVRLAVYDLLLAQEEVRLTGKSMERVRATLDNSRALNQAGLASDYDVLRLEVELANLEPNLSRAERRREAARRAIALELAADPETPIEVAGDLAGVALDDPEANSPANRDILAFAGWDLGDLGSLEADAADFVRRSTPARSDVKQLELTESLRRTEMRVEQSDYLPMVSAFGTYGLAAQQNGPPDFFGDPRQRGSSQQVGLRVSFPVFSGFARRARVGRRRIELMKAETQTSLVRSQAEVQLRNLVDEVAEALARAKAQRLAVSQAARGQEIAGAQFREGLSTRIEVIDAETALRQSEFNYAQAVYDFLAARARLDEAAGRVPLVDTEHYR